MLIITEKGTIYNFDKIRKIYTKKIDNKYYLVANINDSNTDETLAIVDTEEQLEKIQVAIAEHYLYTMKFKQLTVDDPRKLDKLWNEDFILYISEYTNK